MVSFACVKHSVHFTEYKHQTGEPWLKKLEKHVWLTTAFSKVIENNFLAEASLLLYNSVHLIAWFTPIVYSDALASPIKIT